MIQNIDLQLYDLNKINHGFSDIELETLCGVVAGEYSHSHPQNLEQKPALYFMGKVNGYGTALRNLLNLPGWYPLPFSLDHGIAFASELSSFEQNKASAHFVWDKERYDALAYKHGSRIRRIRNPVISMIERQNIKKVSDAQGTIVFIPHTNDSCTLRPYNWHNYISKIEQRFKKSKRIVLCIHPHDIKNGNYKKFRQFGKPLITFGNNTSDLFIHRFLSTLIHFEYATGISPGSEAFYCSSIEVDYIQFGEKIDYVYAPNSTADDNSDNLVKKYRDQRDHLFSEQQKNSEQTKQFIADRMGLDISIEDSTAALRRILIRDSILLILPLTKIIIKNLLKAVLGRNK